jgi:hypothetical protein
MSTLAAQIHRELECGERCAVYEFELIRIWPLNEKNREAKIVQFAKEHGFRVRFYRMGWCAIFDRQPVESAATSARTSTKSARFTGSRQNRF